MKVDGTIEAVRTGNVAKRDQVFFGGLVRCERRQVDFGRGRRGGGVGLVYGGGLPMPVRCWGRGCGRVGLVCGRAQKGKARRWSGCCGPRRVVFGHIWLISEGGEGRRGREGRKVIR